MGDEATRAALAEMWAKVLDEAVARLPEDAWEILVAYISVETGDVLVYPTTAKDPVDREDMPRVSLTVADWVAGAEEIEDLPESRYERAYARLLKGIAGQLKKAIDDPRVAPRFAELKKRRGFAVFYVDAVEVVHPANLAFLWGTKPPRPIPSGSAREMFEFLMNKAHIYPGSVMKLEGDRVVQVTFFGAEFNDTYVDLLGQVPDVHEVCKDLRELILEHTRIKPPAIDRLRQLLPHVRIEIIK